MTNSLNLQPGDTMNDCPACGNKLATVAEMAAHVCPRPDPTTDPDPIRVQQADFLTRMKAEQRRLSRAPTRPELQKDGRSICDAVHTQWDGEVDCVSILLNKASGDIVVTRTVTDRNTARTILRKVLDSLDKSEAPTPGPGQKPS